MDRTHLGRSLVVFAFVLVGIIAPTAPVAAATHDATITDGIVTVYGAGSVPQDAYDLAPFVPHCSDGTLELDLAGPGPVSVTSLESRTIVSYFGAIGNPYLRVITRIDEGSAEGTLTGTGPYAIDDVRVGLRVVYYDASGYEDTTCEPDGLWQCDVNFSLELDGTLTGTTPSSTATLTGVGVGTVAEGSWCAGDLATLVGSTVAVSTPLTATLTS